MAPGRYLRKEGFAGYFEISQGAYFMFQDLLTLQIWLAQVYSLILGLSFYFPIKMHKILA